MTRRLLRHLAALAVYAPIGVLIGLLLGAGFAHANTFAAPFAVRAYSHGVAVYSGSQVYTCAAPLATNTYAGQGFVIAQACGADRVFRGDFQ